MKKRRLLFIVVLSACIGMGIVFTFSFARVDQYQGRESSPRNMLMANSIQESKMHCQMSLSSLEEVTRQIKDAKALVDPEQVIAELNDAERVLREMREHLTMCNSIVQTMDQASVSQGI